MEKNLEELLEEVRKIAEYLGANEGELVEEIKPLLMRAYELGGISTR